MGPLGLIAIELGTIILGEALKALRPKPKPQPLERPTADEDRVIPLVIGTGVLQPNIIAWGDTTTTDIRDDQTAYFARMIGGLCLGPVDQLLDIVVGDKSVRLWPVSKNSSGDDDIVGTSDKLSYVVTPFLPLDRPTAGTSSTLYVSALDLFGGAFATEKILNTSRSRFGGVAGVMRMHWGEPNEDADDLTTHLLGTAKASGWPHVAYLTFGADPDGDWDAYQLDNGLFYWGTSNVLPNVKVVVRCFPHALLGTVDAARVRGDANPAEAIYLLLTDQRRGAGLDASLIDTAAFTTAANVFSAEQMGVSLTLDDERSVYDVIDDICRTVDATVFKDPATGLLSITVMRQNYVVADLPNITPSNTTDFELHAPSTDDTTNEVRVSFRRFDGAVSGNITDEPLTGPDGVTDDDFVILGLYVSYQVQGTGVTELTVRNVTQGVDIPSDHYSFTANGSVLIGHSQVEEGDDLTASYTATPPGVGYRDAATAPEQDLANIEQTGFIRAQTVAFPYLTSDYEAQRACVRVLRKLSLPLQPATWTMNRQGYALKPGDVVRLNFPDHHLTDAPFRISKPTWGPLENGGIAVEAVADVFGATGPLSGLSGTTPIDTPTRLTAPGINLSCVSPGAIRVGLFPSDTTFTITLERADDLAFTTGVTTLSSTITGTTTYYDDTQTDGVTKYYRAKLTRTGYQDGAYSAVLSCTASAGTPGTPVCTIPTYTVTSDEDAGSVTLTITDPQVRVTEVRYRTRSGNGAWSAWTIKTTPYTFAVALTTTDSRIEWEIDYTNCAGDTATYEGAKDFLVTPVAPGAPTYITVDDESADLPNARQLAGESGVVSVTDGGAGATVEIGLEDGGVPLSKLAQGGATDGQAAVWDDGAGTWAPGDVTVDLSSYAPLASPALTGTPTAPTAASGTNTTQLATTAFVQDAVDAVTEAATRTVFLPFTLGDGTNVIPTGLWDIIRVPAGTIKEVGLDGNNASGSIVLDFWVDTYANLDPTVADTITASAKPTISAGKKYKSTTLTGWTTTVGADSWLAINVDSASTFTLVRGYLIIEVDNTALTGNDSIVAFSIGDGVNVIPSGLWDVVRVPAGDIIEVALDGKESSGSIVVDLWVDTYANLDPTVADTITASAKPTISAGKKTKDTTLTGWTTTVAADNWLAINVDSASTFTLVRGYVIIRRAA